MCRTVDLKPFVLNERLGPLSKTAAMGTSHNNRFKLVKTILLHALHVCFTFGTFLCCSHLDNNVKIIKFEVMWWMRVPDDKFSIFSLNIHTILTVSKPNDMEFITKLLQ